MFIWLAAAQLATCLPRGENFDSNILTFDNVADAGAKTGWDRVQNIDVSLLLFFAWYIDATNT